MAQIDLDHVGFAVNDAGQALRNLYRTGVILPVAGEEDDEFRWVIGRRQDEFRGIRVELLDANHNANSFLARYLRAHGEGAHHVTFMVADINDTLSRLRDADISVTQIDLSYPPWREFFIHPFSGLGTVVQVASSVYAYPFGRQVSHPIAPERMPHRRSGRHRDWWYGAVDTSVEPIPVTVSRISIGVTDADRARTVFGDVLGGRQIGVESPVCARYEWPSGSIEVAVSEEPRIEAVGFEAVPNLHVCEFMIGRTVLRAVCEPAGDDAQPPNGATHDSVP